MSRRISFLVWFSHHGLVVFLSPLQALNEMESINMLGVRQICRNCIALQQVSKLFFPSQLWLEWQKSFKGTPIRIYKRHIYELIPLMHGMQQLSCGTMLHFWLDLNCCAGKQALVSVSPSSRDFVEERFDRVRTYYECLNLPFEVFPLPFHCFIARVQYSICSANLKSWLKRAFINFKLLLGDCVSLQNPCICIVILHLLLPEQGPDHCRLSHVSLNLPLRV